ncbi:hypothetical protein FOA52_013721 [Chlamydomonas sp. UWO 241]|nr:hypothetical protein FOA52_013721 [Chlamydomonas sp. UWO 241]
MINRLAQGASALSRTRIRDPDHDAPIAKAASGQKPCPCVCDHAAPSKEKIFASWVYLHCFVVFMKLVEFVRRGCDAQAWWLLTVGSIYSAHWIIVALSSGTHRGATSGPQGDEGSQSQGNPRSAGHQGKGSHLCQGRVNQSNHGTHPGNRLVAALRWLLVHHVCMVRPLRWVHAELQALWSRMSSVSSAASQAASLANASRGVSESTSSASTGITCGGDGVDRTPLRYTSFLVAADKPGTQVFDSVTKFRNLHLSEHPHLALPQGVGALRARLKRKAAEGGARMLGMAVAVRLVRLDVAAGCVVVAARWEVHSAEGASDDDMRALVDDFFTEEMMQDVDQVTEGQRTPVSVLDEGAFDSSSVVWQPLGQPGNDDSDASVEALPTRLGVETGPSRAQTTPVETGDAAELGRPLVHPASPPAALADVPLLAATTLLLALPQSGRNRVRSQFATPLLAHALGHDPELVISFAPAGDDEGAPAPYAMLYEAHVSDLQEDARARGNPPGLMDVDIDIEDLGDAHLRAARERGGMLIVQLVDGPTLLASVLVPLLPCDASPAVVELMRRELDTRTAQHVACDLGLMLLAPRDPAPAARRLRDHALRSLEQMARQAGDLPATLALVEATAMQHVGVAAPIVVQQHVAGGNLVPLLPHVPAPDVGDASLTAVATSAIHGATSAGAAATAHQLAAVRASTTDGGAGSEVGASVRAHGASSKGLESPPTLWCWINVLFFFVGTTRSFVLDGPSRVCIGNAFASFGYSLPYAVVIAARAYPALLARLPRALARGDPAAMRRVWHVFYLLVSALAMGHIQPGLCTFARTGTWTPITALFGLMEPLAEHAWWVRAALPFLIATGHVLVGCACESGNSGGEMLCTRDAWRTYRSTFNFHSFVAARVCAALVVEGGRQCRVWWLSRRHAGGGERRLREKQA